MGLAKLTNLIKVDLSFARCNQIESADELGKGLAKLTNFTGVKSNFGSKSSRTSQGELEPGSESSETSRTSLA